MLVMVTVVQLLFPSSGLFLPLLSDVKEVCLRPVILENDPMSYGFFRIDSSLITEGYFDMP